MSKLLYFSIILIFVSNCSFQKNSKFWTETKKVVSEKTDVFKEIFPEEESLKKEFNSNLKIKLTTKPANNTSINDYLNNNGRLNFDGDLKRSSRYKFSKINNFNQYQPEISFDKDNIIFFDNKGSILKFTIRKWNSCRLNSSLELIRL